MPAIRIGTSGWAYGNWRGVFYPRGLRQADWLAFYARHLDTVEVNASFYRLPRESLVRGWLAKTPEHFRFALKGWRAISHYRRLADCEDLLRPFFAVADLFGAKLGPILFQLPPRFPAEPERLDRFLATLPGGYRYTFEFRDPSWHTEEVYAILRRHDAAFCPFDLAGLTAPRVVTAGFIYVRLHGHARRYRGAYPDAVLADWARWLGRCLGEGREVWVFFDNTDGEAHAVRDALRLRAMLEGGEPSLPPHLSGNSG